MVEHFRAKVSDSATHRNPTYAAMVASMDQSAGRVIKQLAESGFDQDTVIVFTSDNGGLTQRYGRHDGFTENLPLRRGKGSAYEGGVRVPAIIHWPGVTSAGTVCNEPVMTIDYTPTFVEMLGIKTNIHFDGDSLSPLLRDPDASLGRDLFWHYPHYHAGGDGPYSAIRSGSQRLVLFHEDQRVELFDLSNDLGETKDLSKQNPGLADRLRGDLQAWLKSVNAQMPTLNPNHDPARETEVAKRKK